MQVSCQCGLVKFSVPYTAPTELYHCHCLECRAQSASAFGTSAIFPIQGIWPLDPKLEKNLKVWTRQTDTGNTLDCYFCDNCGTRLLHIRRGPPDPEFVSIKGGAIKELQWKGAKHLFVKSAVVSIPSEAERWDGEPDEPTDEK